MKPSTTSAQLDAVAKATAVAAPPARPKNIPQCHRTDAGWVVYILCCADGTLYTGITNDLPRRYGQHNAGTAARYTRSRRPVVLVYREAQVSRSAALKRELAIKRLSRRAKQALLRLAG